MNKLFLTMTLAFSTMIASAQYSVLTTITSVEDEAGETTYNATDKIGVGYLVNDKLMVGLTLDGEDKYEVVGRYALMNGVWGTCVYNYDADSDAELMDKVELGLGYSFMIITNLYFDPSYMLSTEEDSEGEFKLGVSYRF